MEIAKHPEYAGKKIFGKPPTSLKITTETGEELDWSQLNMFFSIIKDIKDGNVRFVLFTTEDSFLKIEYYHPERSANTNRGEDPNKKYLSSRFKFKVIFKKDESSPEQVVDEGFALEDMSNIIKVDPRREYKYINLIKTIAQQNDIKLGLREPSMPYPPEPKENIRITQEYIPKNSITVQFKTKSITNPITNKTVEVPIAVLPKGLYLYRGIQFEYSSLADCQRRVDPKNYDKTPIIFFTLNSNLAIGYANYISCLEVYETTEDIELIDFWNKSVLEDLIDINLYDTTKTVTIGEGGFFSETVSGTQKSLMQKIIGTNRKSEVDFLNKDINASKYEEIFKDGKFQKDESGKNTGFLYKGLIWGSNEGQYKRHSITQVDRYVFSQFLTQLSADISGIYSTDIPSDIHTSNGVNMFHSEIVIPNYIFKTKLQLVGRKQLGNYVGSKRTKKRRTYKKKVRKTKKRTIRYL